MNNYENFSMTLSEVFLDGVTSALIELHSTLPEDIKSGAKSVTFTSSKKEKDDIQLNFISFSQLQLYFIVKSNLAEIICEGKRVLVKADMRDETIRLNFNFKI